ncbi:Ammonium transporter 2 [Durusdinium trenchii]|uniref:Ammonium transporter 2 n=1 Tax=Durusdinium trenchii TaxID=1381693 RepID=A0ABP0QTY8_9DINO
MLAKVATGPPRGICLHSFAQLRSRPPSLFQVVTRQLLRQRDLEASHLSSLLYSHVRVLYFDPGLARLVATRIAAEEWRLEDLATSLQALATFGGSLPSLGVELRLSSTSARRVANEMDQMPLPLLGDLLEASRLEEKGRKSGQRSTHGFCPNKALRRLQGTFV